LLHALDTRRRKPTFVSATCGGKKSHCFAKIRHIHCPQGILFQPGQGRPG
jgi:hypothetical protein